MSMKFVANIQFNSSKAIDKRLIYMLNACAPYHYDDVTGTARRILLQGLEKFIADNGINIDESIPRPVDG